eukprot:Rmarinus@m.9396
MMAFPSMLRCLFWTTVFLQMQDTSEGCTKEEMFDLGKGGFQISLLVSSGCYTSFQRISKQCCDTIARAVESPCALAAFEYTVQTAQETPHLDLMNSFLEDCRVVIGYGHNSTGCMNGRLEGAEQCDDGNDEVGDGCSDCFIDKGYDCILMGNDTASTCLQCAQECEISNRHVCTHPHGPCGDCIEGFQENIYGVCVEIHYVYYVGINAYEAPSGGECNFTHVGQVLEEIPNPSAAVYIDAVKGWQPNPQARARLSANSNCDIATAVSQRPQGWDVVIVAELHVNETISKRTRIRYGVNLVVFSEAPQRPTILGENMYLFDVYNDNRLFLSNIDVTDCRGFEGSLVRNYGISVFENVTTSNCVEYQPTRKSEYFLLCGGFVLSSVGVLVMRDSSFIDNNVKNVRNVEKCMTIENTMVSVTGHVFLQNVTFVGNEAESAMFHVKYLSENSVISDISFVDNRSHRQLAQLDYDVSFTDLTIHNNSASGGFFYMAGATTLTDFEIAENYASQSDLNSGDTGSIILNLGTATFRNGVIKRNTGATGEGGAIANRGTMVLDGVVVEDNQLGGLQTYSYVQIKNSIFRRNRASKYYGDIRNLGILEISDSEFEPFDDLTDPAINSDTIFILRDSVLPDSSVSDIATCGSSSTPIALCGLGARCRPSNMDGIHCYCEGGHVGSPLTMCGPPATVHVLPDEEILVFGRKDADGILTEKPLGLIADGLGDVTWAIEETTVPYWLSISPMTGRFLDVNLCLTKVTDLQLTFFSDGILANDTSRFGLVNIITNTTYEGEKFDNSTTLSVYMAVEVVADSAHSVVSPAQPCENGLCSVEGGSGLQLVIDMYDVEGLPLGVGGTTFSIHVSRDSSYDSPGSTLISLRDFNNGSYTASFTAPQHPFFAHVLIDDQHISGSPLGYSVSCASDYTWDESSLSCKEAEPEVPVAVIAITVVAIFAIIGATGGYMYRARHMFADMFRLVVSDVASIGISGVEEFFDVMSDLGASITVFLSPDYKSYVPYYGILLPITLITSVAFFSVLVSDLRRALRQRYAPTLRMLGGGRRSTSLRESVTVIGMGTFTTLEEVDEAVTQLERKHRRMLIELGLLVVEDIPMLILGTALLMESDGKAPVSVLVSLQITCIIMGITLTNLRGIKETRDQLARLRGRRENAVVSLALMKKEKPGDSVNAMRRSVRGNGKERMYARADS